MHHFRNWLLLPFLPPLLIVGNFLHIFLEPPFFYVNVNNSNVDTKQENTSMYIPGAGFSGFFYTLGRLQAFHNSPISSAQEYHCFSAGCLALVISLLRIPVHSVIAQASSSRDRWIEGEISRYDVVEDFVDGILSNVHLNAKFESECSLYQANGTQEVDTNNIHCHLPRINVITSSWDTTTMLSQSTQTPRSLDHLRLLLIQTTWIPYVTGSTLGKIDDETGMYHNDGALAGLFQNIFSSSNGLLSRPSRHDYSLLLPWKLSLLLNSLNLGLDHDRAIYYWEEGRRRGV